MLLANVVPIYVHWPILNMYMLINKNLFKSNNIYYLITHDIKHYIESLDVQRNMRQSIYRRISMLQVKIPQSWRHMMTMVIHGI